MKKVKIKSIPITDTEKPSINKFIQCPQNEFDSFEIGEQTLSDEQYIDDLKYNMEMEEEYRISSKEEFTNLLDDMEKRIGNHFLFQLKKNLDRAGNEKINKMDLFYYESEAFDYCGQKTYNNKEIIQNVLKKHNLLLSPYYITSKTSNNDSYSFVSWRNLKKDYPRVYEEIEHIVDGRLNKEITMLDKLFDGASSSSGVDIEKDIPFVKEEGGIILRLIRKINNAKYKMLRKRCLKKRQ